MKPFFSLGASFALLTLIANPSFAREVAALTEARSSVVPSVEVPSISDLKPATKDGFSGDYMDEVPAPPKTRSIHAEIFDDTISKEMVEKNAFNVQYEAREHYQLNHIADYHRWVEHNQDVAMWAMRKLLHYHFEKNLVPRVERSLKKKASEKKSSPGQATAQAVTTVYSVHKALKGTKLNFGGETKGKFRFDMPKGLLEFAFTSPLVDTDVRYKAYGRLASGSVGELANGEERLSVGMKRVLSLIGGGVAHARYALSSDTLSYGLSRHIAGPLSAQVDSSRHFSESHRDEFIYRVNFGTNF